MYKSGSLRAPFFVGLNDKMNMKNGESEEPRKGRRFREKVDGPVIRRWYAVMLTAELDGEIIASANIASHGNKSRVAHRAELGISVREEFWRQGIGSALMERLIAAAPGLGFEQIELTASASNRRALNLYLKYGFQVYGTRPHGMKCPDGSYHDDYLMIKML